MEGTHIRALEFAEPGVMGRGGAKDEDEKTTQEVEKEKRKDKKRDQQDDKPQPPQPQKNPGATQKVS
jgi:hypothetical protein